MPAKDPVVSDEAVALYPGVNWTLHENHARFRIGQKNLLCAERANVRHCSAPTNEPVPICARPWEQGIVFGNVKGPEEPGLAQVWEAAPGCVTPCEELGRVVDLCRVVHVCDAEDFQSCCQGSCSAAGEACADDAVAGCETSLLHKAAIGGTRAIRLGAEV